MKHVTAAFCQYGLALLTVLALNFLLIHVMGFNLAGFYLQKGWGGHVPADFPLNRQGQIQEEKHPDVPVLTGINPPVLIKNKGHPSKVIYTFFDHSPFAEGFPKRL